MSDLEKIPTVLANFFDNSIICGFQVRPESTRTPKYLT